MGQFRLMSPARGNAQLNRKLISRLVRENEVPGLGIPDMISAEPRTAFGSGKEDSTWHEPALVCAGVLGPVRRAKGALTALALLAGASAGRPGGGGSEHRRRPAAATGCTGFQDDFATDYPGTLNPDLWAQAGPVA